MGKSWVNQVLLAPLGGADNDVLALVLLSNHRGDVRLESASAQTNNDQPYRKHCHGCIAVLDDWGESRDNQNQVTKNGASNAVQDGLVATEVRAA